ncbi:MAG: hypothetical protein QME81_18225 [bacterium]|nr:hypothetical protein [bacterium]
MGAREIRIHFPHQERKPIPEAIKEIKTKKKIDPWSSLKKQMVKQYPELKNEPDEKSVAEFERLSEKAASNMKFKTLEELEKFMRREDYDFS